VNNGEFSTVHDAGPDQNCQAGSGPVQEFPKENPFEKFCDFPACFLLSISLNIGLHFYTVKIQV